MKNFWIYEVEINRFGTGELIKKLHVLSAAMFDVSHFLMNFIYDNEHSEFSTPVEIGSIRRFTDIENVLIDFEVFDDEDRDEYTGKEPLEMADRVSPEKVFKFKCSCGRELRVVDDSWPYVICPSCHNNIKRSEVENVGGIYIYQKAEDGD